MAIVCVPDSPLGIKNQTPEAAASTDAKSLSYQFPTGTAELPEPGSSLNPGAALIP